MEISVALTFRNTATNFVSFIINASKLVINVSKLVGLRPFSTNAAQ